MSFLFFATLFWFFRYVRGFVWGLDILLWISTAFLLQFLMHLLRYVSKRKLIHHIKLSNALWLTALSLLLLDLGLRFSTDRWLTWSEWDMGYYQSIYDYDGGQWWVHQPDTLISLQSGESKLVRQTNSLGLGCEDISAGGEAKSLRVFAFGNSYSEGYGVELGQTWPARLEELVEKRQREKADIYNVAVSGSDPYFAYRMFSDTLASYQPDYVVLAINSEDIRKLTYRGGMERFNTNGKVNFRPAPWWEPFYKASILFRIFAHGYCNDLLISDSEYEKRIAEEVEKLLALIKQWDEECRQKGMAFLVVLHPQPHEAEKTYGKEVESLIALLEKKDNSILWVNTMPMIQGAGEEKSFDHLHLSSSGHYAIATAVFEAMVQTLSN